MGHDFAHAKSQISHLRLPSNNFCRFKTLTSLLLSPDIIIHPNRSTVKGNKISGKNILFAKCLYFIRSACDIFSAFYRTQSETAA